MPIDTIKPSSCDITVVVQGPLLAGLTEHCLRSIAQWLPEAHVIISSWEGSDVSSLSQFDIDVVLSKDPGFKPRGASPDSKPNNVNRQIVSSLAGLKQVRTKYALKMRSDFVFIGDGFLNAYGTYPEYDFDYKIFESRVIVSMFGTAKPLGDHYNLPYHVSDFISFGRTSDLVDLYDIDLVTDEEFDYFNLHPEKPRDTYAVNLYNAEQSIVMNWLRKNGRTPLAKYSTDVDDAIVEDSEKYIVNNFYPMPFRKLGIYPLKDHLLPRNNIQQYSDYYTRKEWHDLYAKHIKQDDEGVQGDHERELINALCGKIAALDRQVSFWKKMPRIVKIYSLAMIAKKKKLILDQFEASF